MRLAAATVCVLAVTSGRVVRAAEVEPPLPASWAAPPTVHKIRGPMLAVGIVTFAVSYLAAVVAGESVLVVEADGCDRNCSPPAPKYMFIPIAGPLIAGTQPGARVEFGFPSWVYPTWSVVEAAGVAMIVVGLIGHDVPVRPIVTRDSGAVALSLAW